MNSLLFNALELQHVAHELTYLGMNGDPIYSDTFCRLNKEVLDRADSLYLSRSSDAEEEANLCLALLRGYNASGTFFCRPETAAFLIAKGSSVGFLLWRDVRRRTAAISI